MSKILVPPKYVLVSGVFTPKQCQDVIDLSESIGLKKGPSEFSKQDVCNNLACRIFFEENLEFIWAKDIILELSPLMSEIMQIKTYPKLDFVQISRYDQGTNYGFHVDHDPTRRSHTDVDRKISLVVPLSESPESGIWLDGIGHLGAGLGDLICFSGLLGHSAPEQKEGTRYTLAAWIGGPRWT